MSTRRSTILLALALMAVTGCDTPALTGHRRDAGLGPADAAALHDSGPRPDVGMFDTGGDVCASVRLETTRVTPTVIVVVDQSLSMENELADGVSRWDAVHRVLTGSDGLITTLEEHVRFGLALYSDVQGGSPECPMITSVSAALGSRDALDAAYAAAAPLGETPTGDALEEILDGLSLDATSEPPILVLATDGSPDRCGMPDAHDDTSRSGSVAAITRAHGVGIRSYVIGVGRGSVATSHLQALADAGQGGTRSPFFEADSVADLAEALRTIVRGELTCTLALEGRIVVDHACEGTVSLDGMEIPCGDADGWHATDDAHIELVGASCDALLDGNVAIDASFPCTALVI